MKISLLLIAALLPNTTFLLAEPIFAIFQGINPLIFVALEAVLILGFLVNKFLGDLSKAIEINLGHLDIFVHKKRR